MPHSSKSPYEIRLNALQLAQRTLSEQYAAESAREQLDNGAEIALVSKAPTPDEIIAAAEKFNNFISKDTHRN